MSLTLPYASKSLDPFIATSKQSRSGHRDAQMCAESRRDAQCAKRGAEMRRESQLFPPLCEAIIVVVRNKGCNLFSRPS